MRVRFALLKSSLVACGIVALAFAARLYRLGDANVWWDEGWTIWLAQQDWSAIALRTAADEHPPLHYWAMNLWQLVTGPDAFTGRFFSLAFAILTIALVFRLGKAMGGTRLGLLAALFLALARFNVWWSQDIKNYTLAAFFAWASIWFMWRWLFPPASRKSLLDRAPLVGYALVAAFALLSHYLAALLLIAANLMVGIVLVVRWRRGQNVVRPLGQWALAQLAVLVLFAPWLYLYLANGATWTAAPALDFTLFLRLAATVLTLGVTTFIENYTLLVLAVLSIALLGVGWVVSSLIAHRSLLIARRPAAAVLCLLILALPPLLIYALALTPAAIFAPKIQARYLMMLTPALALLLGLGVLFIARYSRFAAMAAAVLIIGAQVFTLNDYYAGRRLRDEYFSLAQIINQFGADGDAVVLNTDQEYPTFLYYLNEAYAWVGVPNGAGWTTRQCGGWRRRQCRTARCGW